MRDRLSEPNRVLGPRRAARTTAVAWALAAFLHAAALAVLLMIPVEEPPVTTFLIPLEPGIETAANAPREPEAAADAPAELAGGPRRPGGPGEPESEGGLTMEVPSTTGTTGATGTPVTRRTARVGAAAVVLGGPLMPLVATPYGVRRRESAPDPARLARARAESIVNARIATVVEARPAPSAGPLSLAGGGVSLSIPWGGFVRGDRTDEAWREKRCAGKDDGGDKPGEAEARRAQCD